MVACIWYNRDIFLNESAIDAISLPYVQRIFPIILKCLFILVIFFFFFFFKKFNFFFFIFFNFQNF